MIIFVVTCLRTGDDLLVPVLYFTEILRGGLRKAMLKCIASLIYFTRHHHKTEILGETRFIVVH